MSEEEKFDELLRSKLSEREFFFDEMNWQKAETMLKRRLQTRTIMRYAAVFLGGLMLGAAVVYSLSGKWNSDKLKSSTVPATLAAKLKDASGSTIVPPPASKTADNLIQKEEAKPITASAGMKRNKNDNSSHVAPVLNGTHRRNDVARPSSSRMPAVAHSNREDRREVSNKQTVPEPSKAANNKNDMERQMEAVTNVEKQKQTVAKDETESPNASKVQAQADNIVQPTAIAENSAPVQNITPAANKEANSASQLSESINGANSDIQQKSTTTPKNIANDNSKTVSPPVATTPNNIANNAQASAPQKSDTDSTPIRKTTGPPSPGKDFMTQTPAANVKSPPATNIIYIEAGTGYNLGWIYNVYSPAPTSGNIREGNGISPVADVKINHRFSDKFSVNVGIGYTYIANLNETFSSENNSYDFGLNSTMTTVTPQIFHYLMIPLEFQYSINENNYLIIGGKYLHLVTTTSSISTVTDNGLAPPTTQKQAGWGNMTGFNPNDAEITLAYRKRIYHSIFASAEVYYGLIDVLNSQNTYFANGRYRNTGFRLMLSYNLNK